MAERTKLSVETGVMTIDVENELGQKIGEFVFNPSDSSILKRYDKVAEFFNSVEFKADIEDEQKMDEVRGLDTAIGEQFDYLLGYKVSEGLFGACGALTILKNGDFYFERVLKGIGDLVESEVKQRVGAKIAKINKATEKYNQ